MREDTVGRLLVRAALPKGVPAPTGPLNKKAVEDLYQALAEIAPDQFRAVSKRLSDIAADAGTLSGGYSFGTEHLRPTPEIQAVRDQFRAEISAALADPTLGDDARNDKLVHIGLKYTQPLTDAVSASTKGNPLALQASSGAKGNVGNLKSLLAGDTLYSDAEYNPVPFPVTSSFYDGLRPHEYTAGTFGARLAIINTKLSTAQGGYFSKRLRQAAHRLLVSARDAEEGADPDADQVRGYRVPASDPYNEGALLAAPAAGFKRNTVLTRDVLADIRKSGVSHLIVRSPIVGGPPDGGVYGNDVGVRERGAVAPVGDQVGLAGADALSEPATQAIIGCLAEGTLVRMADGSVKCIENICCGDLVLGSDDTGRTAPAEVVHTFSHGDKECVRVSFMGSIDGTDVEPLDVEATADHKFLITDGGAGIQVPLGDMDGDDEPQLSDESPPEPTARKYRFAGRRSIGMRATYDIEVANDSHLFVLANGTICSNSKHTGGVVGATKTQQGFPVLDKIMSIPEEYGGAVHAQLDGQVSTVRPAAHGGHYVLVAGEEHYVPPGQTITVKAGDRVEAGDPLTDDVENPAEYVRHKGIGEARRRFIDVFTKAAVGAGFRPDRKNVELLARGYIDHVQMEREYGGHVPGDVVSYTSLERDYEPRPDHKVVDPHGAVGGYLERPALHYTIGTRVTPAVAAAMKEAGVQRVKVHPAPPPFTPIAVRSHDVIGHDPDPMTRMLGSNLERGVLRATARGDVTDPFGTSFVPALAEGTNFNTPDTKSRGWLAGDLKLPGQPGSG